MLLLVVENQILVRDFDNAPDSGRLRVLFGIFVCQLDILQRGPALQPEHLGSVLDFQDVSERVGGSHRGGGFHGRSRPGGMGMRAQTLSTSPQGRALIQGSMSNPKLGPGRYYEVKLYRLLCDCHSCSLVVSVYRPLYHSLTTAHRVFSLATTTAGRSYSHCQRRFKEKKKTIMSASARRWPGPGPS